MDPETKKMLEENLRLSKENNDILKKMVRIHRWTQIYRVIYWVLILGASFGAYYFIQPYIDSLLNYYGSVSDSVDTIKKVGTSVPDLKHVQDLLNQMQN
jgi:hypothetical protein